MSEISFQANRIRECDTLQDAIILLQVILEQNERAARIEELTFFQDQLLLQTSRLDEKITKRLDELEDESKEITSPGEKSWHLKPSQESVEQLLLYSFY